ncbi:NAD(P)H-quinone oxidoreductase subunit F [compost metagenome]
MAKSTFPPSSEDSRPTLARRIGGGFARIDHTVVDGLINACGFVVFAVAEGLRTLLTGKVQVALLVAMAVLVATLIAVMLGLPNLLMGAGGSSLC